MQGSGKEDEPRVYDPRETRLEPAELRDTLRAFRDCIAPKAHLDIRHVLFCRARFSMPCQAKLLT